MMTNQSLYCKSCFKHKTTHIYSVGEQCSHINIMKLCQTLNKNKFLEDYLLEKNVEKYSKKIDIL